MNYLWHCLAVCAVAGGLARPTCGQAPGQSTSEKSFATPPVRAYFALPPPARGAYFHRYLAPSTPPKNGSRPALATYTADVMLLDLEALLGRSLGLEVDWDFLGEMQITNPQRFAPALQEYQARILEADYRNARDPGGTQYHYAVPASDNSRYSLEAGIMLKYAKLVPAGRIAFIRENVAVIPLDLLRLMQVDLNQLYHLQGKRPIATRAEMLAALANYHP